jgi:hypothetical protein
MLLHKYLKNSLLLFMLVVGLIAFSGISHAAITETFTNETGKNGVINEYYRATGNVSIVSEGVGISTPNEGPSRLILFQVE